MRNMKALRGSMGVFALVFAASLLLLLPGCQGPFGPQESEPGMGTVSLAIEKPALGRTIMPTIGLSDFVSFAYSFTHPGFPNDGVSDTVSGGGDTVGISVTLPVADGWTFTVTAYLPGPDGTPAPAARATGTVNVTADGITPVSAQLFPIPAADGDYGMFTWAITLADGIEVTQGSLNVFYVDADTGDFGDSAISDPIPFNLDGDSWTGSLELAPGTYFVDISLYDANDAVASVGMDLYVFAYQNMPSHFARHFLARHFLGDGDDPGIELVGLPGTVSRVDVEIVLGDDVGMASLLAAGHFAAVGTAEMATRGGYVFVHSMGDNGSGIRVLPAGLITMTPGYRYLLRATGRTTGTVANSRLELHYLDGGAGGNLGNDNAVHTGSIPVSFNMEWTLTATNATRGLRIAPNGWGYGAAGSGDANFAERFEGFAFSIDDLIIFREPIIIDNQAIRFNLADPAGVFQTTGAIASTGLTLSGGGAAVRTATYGAFTDRNFLYISGRTDNWNGLNVTSVNAGDIIRVTGRRGANWNAPPDGGQIHFMEGGSGNIPMGAAAAAGTTFTLTGTVNPGSTSFRIAVNAFNAPGGFIHPSFYIYSIIVGTDLDQPAAIPAETVNVTATEAFWPPATGELPPITSTLGVFFQTVGFTPAWATQAITENTAVDGNADPFHFGTWNNTTSAGWVAHPSGTGLSMQVNGTGANFGPQIRSVLQLGDELVVTGRAFGGPAPDSTNRAMVIATSGGWEPHSNQAFFDHDPGAGGFSFTLTLPVVEAHTGADGVEVRVHNNAGATPVTHFIIDSISVTRVGDLPPPDTTALATAISTATAALGTAVVNTAAANVPPAQQWVTQGVRDTLYAAIGVAQGVMGNVNATQAMVNAAVTTLNTARTTFEGLRQPGAPLDAGRLGTAISAAEGLLVGTVPSADGIGITSGYWAPQAAIATFQGAVTTAGTALTAATTRAQIDAAIAALEGAQTAFMNARQPGIYVPTGTGGINVNLREFADLAEDVDYDVGLEVSLASLPAEGLTITLDADGLTFNVVGWVHSGGMSTGNSLTLQASQLNLGTNNVTLIVEIDDRTYSRIITFRVAN